jgi:hypothetical protein
MADSLLQLKAQVESAKPAAPTPQPAPTPRGDDLMAKAKGIVDLDDDDIRLTTLFKNSEELVRTRMSQDPAFEKAFLEKIQPLEGEHLAQAIIDSGDELRIDYLKRTDQGFTSEKAAASSFLNSATFGQLSRIVGKAGELIEGRPYEEVVQEQAEKMRLMEKAFPKSSLAGEVASYLIPGSPAKALFTRAASFGARGAGKVISKIIAKPGLLQKIGQSAAAGAAGSAAVAATSGTLGSDLDSIDLERGGDEAFREGAVGAILGGGVVAGASGLGEAARIAAPAVRSFAKGVEKTTSAVVEQASGTSANALKAFNRDAKGLKKAFGTERQIGDDLTDFLLTHKRSKLPEVKLAEELLPQLPKVDSSATIDYLRSFKPGVNPGLDNQVSTLNEWANRIEKSIGRGKVDPTRLRDVVDDLQTAVAEQFGKESPFLADALKKASRIARTTIVDTAQSIGGDAGKSYVQLMEKAADKRQILQFVQRQMGRDPIVMEKNSERFVSQLFGKNKEIVRSRLQQLDQQFGTNFYERSQQASFARQLGPNGEPSPLPNQFTGASGKGTQLGGAIGSAVGYLSGGLLGAGAGASLGAGAGAVASSPRAGALLIGGSDKISGFLRRMVANPDALKRIGLDRGTPFEVRRMAQEISNTLIKDGPVSAGGVTRLVADTPYFVGLVHHFEVAERKQKQEKLGIALQKQRANQPQ